jgi:hypothetical protein
VTVPLFGDNPEPLPGEEWAIEQFHHYNLRIGRNRTVHRSTFLPDERGVQIPAPDCHAGYFAAGRPWWKVYTPTTDRVDCGLCLDGHRGHGQQADLPGHQLTLEFDLPAA